jgi:hypothetical protein
VFRRSAILLVLILEAACPQAASSQLSHVDSVLARSLAALVLPIEGGAVILTGDTSLRPLLEAVPKPVGICLPMLYIETLTATIRGRAGDSTHLDLTVHGSLLRPGNQTSRQRILSGSFAIALPPRDFDAIEAGRDPYVRMEDGSSNSFWSRTLEPALVVIGAAVIVALFFLVHG